MNALKLIWKSKLSRVWLIVGTVVVALMTVVTILTTTVFYEAIKTFLGSERAVYAEGMESIYLTESDSKEDALKRANALNEELCEEGSVLLKNDNAALPLDAGVEISVFGKNSVNLVYGGSGSGGGDNSGAKTIFDSLTSAGFTYNSELKKFYEDTAKSGPARQNNPSDLDSGGNQMLSTAETPRSSYEAANIASSYANKKDAALIVLSRIGGEGFDLPRTSADDLNRHYLELDPNEKDLINMVCTAGFKKVVLVINSSNAMELGFVEQGLDGKAVDACLFIGGPGNSGIMALGRILNGEVNPSGRTVDTWAADFTQDPTWHNFGDNRVENGDRYNVAGKNKPYYFVDYEEGIYIGYRYYETRGITDGKDWYNENVVYPFGYGLSYTEFEWTLADASSISGKNIDKGQKYSVEVTVKNSGSVPGKEVVQLYANPPYTVGEIEKPHVMLCGFAKTPVLYPDADKAAEPEYAADGKDKPNEYTVTLTFDPYYMASYDYNDANKNGHKTFEIDAGDGYNLFVSRNAHDSEFTIPFAVASDIIYDKDETTGNDVKNRYDGSDDQLSKRLSRADWAGTMPDSPTDAERGVTQEFLNLADDRTTNNPTVYTEIPVQGKKYVPTEAELVGEEESKQVTLRSLIGVPYDEKPELWDALLDQLTVEEMAGLFNNGAFHTEAVMSIGKPLTTDADGPVGFTVFLGQSTVYGTCSYCSQVVLASTWNKELIERMGASVGEEGLWGNVRGDGAPYSGWYAPGANLHRSPFGGRNFEYFSEDSYLSGMMAAHEIKGAMSKGVYTFVKHFALNEQETHRNGLLTWATEQTIREVYLRPFEMAVKLGKTRGMMSSFNRIGTKWTGGDYRLLTEILREEWGFRGSVISDFNRNSYMNPKQMAYAGGDINLCNERNFIWRNYDATNAADVSVLRNCAKNILYTVANSNAMNGEVIGYKLPVWTIWLIVIDSVLLAGIAVWGVIAIIRALKTPRPQ